MSSANPSSQEAGPDFVIVGPLRSGTTLLRLILNSHPDLALVGEFEESVRMLGDSGFPTATEYKEWLSLQRIAQTRRYDLDSAGESYERVVASMWRHLAKELSGAHQVGCTIHSRIDRILDLWPNTKFVCLVRDPRDVARSCVGMGWHGHAAAATSKWLLPLQRTKLIKGRLSADRWIQVRYEDLLRSPQEVLTKCARFLGVDYHPEMLRFHEVSTYGQLDPNLAEQWRRKMTARCAEVIDSFCAPVMAEYGYETSTDNPRLPSRRERIVIWYQDKFGKLRWRIRRYGLGLDLASRLVRFLPATNRWRQSIAKRVNQIDHQHLK